MLPIERLEKTLIRYKKSETVILKNVKPETEKRVANGSLSQYKITSLHSWFVAKNLNLNKQYLSNIGLLYHFANSPNLNGWGSDFTFGYIFCSDNKKVIDACVSLEQKREFFTDGGALPWPGNAVANAYLENWELLEEDCFYIKKGFGHEPYINDRITFFNALAKGDIDEMKKSIDRLSSQKYWNDTQIKTDLIPQFIILPTLTFCKLAWMKGYEIEVNSPYIPNEWLPIQPIETYSIPYDFMIEHCQTYNLV